MRALVFSFLILIGLSAQSKIDDSADIFFPKSLKYLQYSQTEFPVFWWNFAVIEPGIAGNPDFAKAQKLCENLQLQVGGEVKRILCGDNLASFVPSLIEWSNDLILRQPAPPLEQVKNRLKGAMSEIGLLSSVNQDLFNLKRADPLDQWQIYLEKTQALSETAFKREKGFLVDPKTARIVLPIQFSQRPQMKNVLQTEEILSHFRDVVLVGAHASAYINEKQVHEDMEIVSIVGLLVLIAFIGFLVLKGRTSALLLFPPVALALGLAALIVNFVFGSIHGLTLAFGSGIVGLAVDYGLHGAFNSESKQTWKSNAVGFLTTLTGLVVMVMSGIPLIKQMMFFAGLGLFFGFLFFYYLCRYLPHYFTMRSLHFPQWNFKYSHILVIGLIVLGFGSLFKADMSFDLRKINFQPPQEKKITDWFFTQGGEKENFLLLQSRADFGPQVMEESRWAHENNIQYTGIGDYGPPSEEAQVSHLESWQRLCLPLKKSLSQNEAKVFSPFLENICQTNAKPLGYAEFSQRQYLSHLVGHEGFISLFTSVNKDQAQTIREKYPKAQSLMESIKGFSAALENDLRWMIPTAFILSTLILLAYYRSMFCVLTAYIPFFTGLGLFFLVNLIRGSSLDLISVLGLLMVFGFSLDYGVFATDIYKFPQLGEDKSAVYSALGLAALTNIIGFFPMIFAQHPVLHQLGTALFFGTIGTYMGTVWGIERLYNWRKSR
jgi:hypothetical protein